MPNPSSQPIPPYGKKLCAMIAEGMTTKQISQRVDQNPSAIDVYIFRIMKNVGVRNRRELVRVYFQSL